MDTSKGIAVADLGGATPWPPPYFKANLRPAERGKNIFEASPPSYLRHWMSVAPTYLKIWIRPWIVGINCSKKLLVWAVFSDTDKLFWANTVTDHRNKANFGKTPKPLITFKSFKSQVYFNCRFFFLNKMFSHWHGHSAFIVTVRDFVGEFRLFLFCGILGYTITNTTLTLKTWVSMLREFQRCTR